MSDSREDIAQAIRESQSDDYREETEMENGNAQERAAQIRSSRRIGRRDAGGFRDVNDGNRNGRSFGRISRYSDGSWVGFPATSGPTGVRVYFGSVGMQRAADMLVEVETDRRREADSLITETAPEPWNGKPEAKPEAIAVGALRDLYDIVRELADCGIVDPDEIGEGDPELAERFVIAVRGAESVLVDTVGPQAVK